MSDLVIHDLKCWNPSFTDILSGAKTFEVRVNDVDDYRVGDILLLREYDSDSCTFSGRKTHVRVTYVLPLEPWVPGYVGMSIERGWFEGDAGATFRAAAGESEGDAGAEFAIVERFVARAWKRYGKPNTQRDSFGDCVEHELASMRAALGKGE